MLLLITSCSQHVTKSENQSLQKSASGKSISSNQYTCGAYAEYRNLTNEDLQLFHSTYSYKLKLTPQSVATQVVAGTNYKFICTDESGRDIQVMIFKPLSNRGQAKVTSIVSVSGKDTPELVAVAAQVMYDDVLSAYNSKEIAEKGNYAFGKYASVGLKKLLDDVDKAINKGEIEPMIYGWDFDPWIAAQDWEHPNAEVVEVRDFSATCCSVCIAVNDTIDKSETQSITLTLVKEDGHWMVDDFSTTNLSGDNTFASMLRNDFESAKRATHQ